MGCLIRSYIGIIVRLCVISVKLGHRSYKKYNSTGIIVPGQFNTNYTVNTSIASHYLNTKENIVNTLQVKILVIHSS